MKKLYISIAVIILTLIVILFVSSCKSENPDESGKESTKETIGEEDTTEEVEYEFPNIKYGGEFNFLCRNYPWLPNFDIVLEEEVGEAFGDSIYYRNMQIEEQFGIKLKQMAFHPDDVLNKARIFIQAGDDTYDAMVIPHAWGGYIGVLALEGYYCYDLNTLPELNLDKPWWTQYVNKQLKIGASDSLYFAANDIEIFNMQSMMNLYVNEKIIQDLGLDMPYDLVKEGKWTLDEYEKYVKAAVNLNGDETFRWNKNGNSIYGHASFHMGATAMLFGTGVKLIDFDEKNLPYFCGDNERFYNAVQKLASILSEPGHYIYGDTTGADRVIEVFMPNRSIFMDSTIYACYSLRDMDDPFGILPMPKYDTNQEDYITIIHPVSSFTVIPSTNENPGKAATILDAMAYITYKDVRPKYYESVLPYKHLRTEIALEMLDILMETRSIHTGYVYNWTTDLLNNDMRMIIQSSDPNIASLIDSRKDSIVANIEKTLDFFKQ